MNSEPGRWRWVSFQRPGALTVELTIGLRKPYAIELDTAESYISLHDLSNRDSGSLLAASFHVSAPSQNLRILDGDLNGKTTHLELVKMALSGNVHWIFVPPKEDDK